MREATTQARQAVAELLFQLDQGNANRTQTSALVLAIMDREIEKAITAGVVGGAAANDGDGEETVLQLLRRVATGECTTDEADGFIAGREEQLRATYAEQYGGTLLDTFASMAQVPSSFEGVMPEALAKVVMGEDPPPAAEALARFTWFCQAEGRVRYIKANAMMEAREL